ncbi:MAG TPA: type II toxin-antitoxin system PemK/MazF family toxin [bacterium]|nr:type II toxin-antitoxin system PemK/MazF family toxin [bacterium]
MKIKRGHLYTADLNPRFGTEPGKVRPVLVLQTDLINTDHPSTLVCLLTTRVRPETEILRVHLRKGEAGVEVESDVMIDQLRAIDNRRLKKEIGKLSPSRLEEIERKLKTVLDLE